MLVRAGYRTLRDWEWHGLAASHLGTAKGEDNTTKEKGSGRWEPKTLERSFTAYWNHQANEVKQSTGKTVQWIIMPSLNDKKKNAKGRNPRYTILYATHVCSPISLF